MHFLLLSGSFHSKSRSLAILAELPAYFPEYQFTTPDLSLLPFFSEDLLGNKPDNIVELLALAEKADGIIICTPEYNHSMPGVLKNALDWLSRPAFESVLKNKPCAIITQADSPVGGARAQAQLKLVLDSTLSCIMPAHEMMISGVSKIFDANMHIVDAQVEARLKRHVQHFAQYVEKISTF